MASVLALSLALAVSAPSDPPRQPPKLSKKAARAMALSGASVVVGLGWAAGLVAAKHLDSDSPRQRDLGRLIPVPVVGPALAAQRGSKDRIPLAVLSGYQAAAWTLTTIGVVSWARHGREDHTPRSRLKKTTGALILTQGVMFLVTSYGMTVGFTRSRLGDDGAFARRMVTPVVGPLWATSVAPDYTRGYWAVTSGAFQLASVGAIVWGSTILARHRRQQRRNVSVLPMPTRDGPRVVATVRF